MVPNTARTTHHNALNTRAKYYSWKCKHDTREDAEWLLTTGIVRWQFPSLRDTPWRNIMSSTRNGCRPEPHIRPIFELHPLSCLTHWDRVTHICVGNLTIICSDNGLSPGRHQAIIWTNAGLLSIGPLRTNFSEMLTKTQIFSFKKMHLKMSSAKWRPFLSRPQCVHNRL